MVYGHEPVLKKQTPALAMWHVGICTAGNGYSEVYVLLHS